MDKLIKHLEFIEAAISRMGKNSFLIKGWAITITSALFALAASSSNRDFVFISYISLISFWILDGFFISTERKFVALYDVVRQKTESEIDFSMKTAAFNTGRNTWLSGIFSSTLNVFYPFLLAITTGVMFFFGRS